LWQKAPQPPNFDTNVFQWDQLAGLFVNPPSTNADHIDNAEGNQLAYLFAYPGMALFQDSSSTDSSGVASHAFNAKFEEGKSYRLIAGITTSKEQPLIHGSTLRLSLYYRDASSNRVTVASTDVTYDTNVFANITHLLDFSVETLPVKDTDPWAGQNIGIQIESPTPSLIGGVWDLDNVRLNELSGATLKNLTVKNSQVIFTVESEPGLNFEILGSNNIAAPTANWTILGVVHNDTGSSGFTEIGQLAPHRFYRAQQIP